jgi:hypothetical protein
VTRVYYCRLHFCYLFCILVWHWLVSKEMEIPFRQGTFKNSILQTGDASLSLRPAWNPMGPVDPHRPLTREYHCVPRGTRLHGPRTPQATHYHCAGPASHWNPVDPDIPAGHPLSLCPVTLEPHGPRYSRRPLNIIVPVPRHIGTPWTPISPQATHYHCVPSHWNPMDPYPACHSLSLCPALHRNPIDRSRRPPT